MTIQYKMLAGGEVINEDSYCCYGNVNNNMTTYAGGSTRTPSWDYDKFEGLKLRLDNTSSYREETNKRQALVNDAIMDELGFTEWLEGRCVYEYDKDGAVSSIHFLPNCPFYLVVAATGMYRMWANNSAFWQVYNTLKKRGLEPMYAYAAAVNLNGQHFNGNVSKLDDMMQLMTHGEHMPFTYQIARKEHLKHITSLTNESFNELRGMIDEIKEAQFLTYNGRDRWFFGVSSHAWNKMDDYPPCHSLGVRESPYHSRVLPFGSFLDHFKQMQEENKT